MTEVIPHQNSISLLAQLESVGGVIDRGLQLPPDLPYEQYVSIGSMIANLQEMSLWLLGDWLAYGEHTYGDKFHQAAEITGKAPQTLLNIQAAARMIPPQRRRPGTVGFWHHYEIRSLPANDQRRLLKRAEEEHLTKAELRRIVREERDGSEDQFQDVSHDVCEACGQRLP